MTVNNLTDLIGKDVYTKNAKYVGKIDDTMVDSERGAVYGVVIQMARDGFLYQMFEQSGDVKKAILIPHRHIIACEDIIVISMPQKYETPARLPMPEPSTGEEAKVRDTI